MNTILKYIFLFALISQLAHAQKIDFSFDYYSVEDGLSQSEVYCIFQDSRGLIWIGTQAGLNRFDGRNFISYEKDPLNSKSISSGWIHSITEDPSGNLWIGTKNGLNKFNPATEEFEHFLTDAEDIHELGKNAIYSIIVDGEDLLWIKTEYTISKFIPSENRFIHYSHKSEDDVFTESQNTFNLPMIKTESGIWASSSYGLQYFSFEHDQIQTFHHKENDFTSIPSENVTALSLDNKGNLFVGTDKGIAYFLTFYKTVRPSISNELNTILTKEGSKQVSGLSYKVQNDIQELMVSTSNGLVNYNLETKEHITYKEDINNPKSLKYNNIRSLFLDNSGNYWIGLVNKGLNKYSPKGVKFKTYKNAGNSGVKINDNVIGSILAFEDEIWAGTWSGGINIINKQSKKVEIIKTDGPIYRRIVDNHIHVLREGKNGTVWIGTKNGISIYSKKTDKFYSFEEYFGVKLPKLFEQNRINDIEELDDNDIIIGTSTGLIYFNTLTKTFFLPTSTIDSENIQSNTVYDIFKDDNFVWIGTYNGLYKINLNHEIVKVYKARNQITKNPEGIYKYLNSSNIFKVTKDRFGILWIATESGINKFDPIKETFQYFTKEEGLPDNTIYEILVDQNSKLWVSSNRGLAVIDALTETITSYTSSDGLQGLEFNKGASYASSNGQFFFGGSDGFNEFFPDSIKKNKTKPLTTLLHYIIIDNNGNQRNKSLFGVDEITLEHNDHSIRIDFAALEYTNPSKNQFKYLLEGQDLDWVSLNEQDYVVFPSLQPGEYTLRVQSSNNDKVWGDETKVNIHVKAPFYNNFWAYFVYLLIVVFIIHRIWSNNKKKQKNANSEIRNKQLMNLKLEQQKEELDIQNTGMTDSINYAKHIQEAMLPSDYLVKKLLPESFIMYMTKDIVSGDFYWLAQRGTKTFIAAVDCTGHGVPGAFMSIIGYDLLKNIVKERGIEDPAEILNQLNYGVSETFRKKTIDEQTVRDGMDIALCVIDHSKHTIEFSGAMNPLCLIRNDSISLIKGNRFSIGSFNDDETNRFENHTFKYIPGDMIYLFSDGYADQFGGPLGKKFKQKRFLHMLLNIHHLPSHKQKIEIEENFANWKGQVEQLDDVLIIGFRL